MAQEPSSKELLEAVKQQESGGRRYDSSGKLLEGPMTKYGTAKGEMQVLDMTNKDPGFGVRPAKDDSAEERARVGRDYLAAMVKRYGDKKTALVAYNWGPGNTDKWLKNGADPAKLPAETQNYVAKITGTLGETKVAQATAPKSGIQRAVYKAAPLSHPMLSMMGPNYQAAMAVSMLADEGEKEGKGENEPSEAEKMLTEATSRPVALASVDLGYQSPFPAVAPASSAPAKQQLQAYKHGGVVHMADGGDLDYFQDPLGAPSAPITADTLTPGKPFKAADALQAAKEVGKGMVRSGKAIAQGVSETPYNLAGMPADVGNLVLTPFGLGSKEPALGSEHLKRLALQAGIRQAPPTDPRDAGFYTMGELGAGLVNPGPIAAKAGQTAEQALTAGGKMAAKEMLRGIHGEGVLAPISPQESIMYAVPPDRPFVGRLDEFVDTIKNPVQLGQLKGQLKGKFRDYDLERVERAFVGMDDKTKLTPDQIKQALAGVHSPTQWISETRPVEQGRFHQGMDNVWDAPLGTTNLYLEQPPEKLAASKLYDEAALKLGKFRPNSSQDLDFNKWLEAKQFLRNPDALKLLPEELVQNLNAKLETVRPSVVDIENKVGILGNIKTGLLYPVLYKNPQAAQGAYHDQPYFRFTEETEKNLLQSAVDAKKAQGMTDHQAFMAVHTDEDFYKQIREESQRVAAQKVHELILQDMRDLQIPAPNMSTIDWNNLPKDALSPDAIPRNTQDFVQSVDDVLEPSVQQLHEAQKRIRNYLASDINKVGEELHQYRPYEGKHRAVTSQPYPIGFTRFSEHEATIPGVGKVEGRHFHELQSDLSKDMRETGSTYGSPEKDQAEYDQLTNHMDQLRNQAMNTLQDLQAQKKALVQDGGFKMSDLKKLEQKENDVRNSLDNQLWKIEDRVGILGSRLRANKPGYSLQEPFAGFETNQMARQQLLMKNAIQSAMREGKRFATFPGNESAKPQLYVGKVLPNLKQVVKDLGGEKAGFEVRQIELPPDKDGNPITATGVVWSPEAAARIVEKGVPFAKGGMVERQVNTARYI